MSNKKKTKENRQSEIIEAEKPDVLSMLLAGEQPPESFFDRMIKRSKRERYQSKAPKDEL